MREKKISSDINRRVKFFNYFFNKGIAYVGEYNFITAMIFEKKQVPLNMYQNTENSMQNVTQNIYNVMESSTYIHPNIEISSQNTSEPTQEFTYKTTNIDNSVSDNSIHLFNSDIAKKFIKFNPDNRTNVKHTSVFSPVINNHAHTASTNKELLKVNSKKSVTIVHPDVFSPVINNHAHTASTNKELLKVNDEKSVTIVHQKDKGSFPAQQMKELGEKVFHRVEERIKVEKQEKAIRMVSYEERIVQQREEKRMTDKIYTMVMKRWDRELSRKGHLYA